MFEIAAARETAMLHGIRCMGGVEQLGGDSFDFGLCRFILENWVLDRWVRYILTVYPVVIVALVGNVWKHFNPENPTANSVFMGEFVRSGSHLRDISNTGPI